MTGPSVEDIAALRADGDLEDYLRSLIGRPATPAPAPLAAVPAPAYRITHPGGWPLGTAATGPTPPPDRCSCAKCKQPATSPTHHNHEGDRSVSPIRPENRDRYPKDWPKISQRIRFERAQGRCECTGECGRGTHDGRCSNIHGQHAYSTGSKVVLTVAHLDHTPENCDPANLRAMCQGCHLHYDREHHRETAAATRRAAVEAAGQLALGDTPAA